MVRAELTALRRQMARRRRWLRWLGQCFTLIVLAVASIPIWIDMPDSPRSVILFPIIFVVVYGFQLNVAIKTLTLASQSVGRESLAEAWDSLVLTGVDARKIVMAKWIAVLRCVWPDFVWVAVLKLGLVWGLSKFFDKVVYWSCYSHLGGGLCYYTWYGNLPISGTSLLSPLNLIVLLSLFSLAEAGLLAALGLFFGFISRKHRLISMNGAVIFRSILIFTAVATWLLISTHINALHHEAERNYPYPNPVVFRWNMTVDERMELLGTIQFVLSPLADGGTLLTTDLLRSTTTYDYIMARLATAVLALAIFGGLIWATLRLAEAVAVRQRALRPDDRFSPGDELAITYT